MRKKLIFLTAFVLMFGLVSSASATTYQWTYGATPDQSWMTGANWNPLGPPTAIAGDSTRIDIAGTGPIIAVGDAAVSDELIIADTIAGVAAPLTMNGGSLAVSKRIYLGDAVGAIGSLYMNGGAITITGETKLYPGHKGTGYVTQTAGSIDAPKTYVGNEGTGYYIMSGGTLTCTNELRVGVGKSDGSKAATGYLNVSGTAVITTRKLVVGRYASAVGTVTQTLGTINVTDDMELGREGTGNLTITDGVINVTDAVKMSESGGTSHIALLGGVIYTNDLRMYNANASINIEMGSMVVTGDECDEIQGYIDSGWITGWGGYGCAACGYLPGQDATVLTACIPEPATMTLLGLGGLLFLRRRR